MHGQFAEFREDGRTVVVVSHGLEQMTFCDEVAWLDRRPAEAGSPQRSADWALTSLTAPRRSRTASAPASAEAQISRIELLDRTGASVSSMRRGRGHDPHLPTAVGGKTTTPVFGCSIDTREHIFCRGLHGLDDGSSPREEPGEGAPTSPSPR